MEPRDAAAVTVQKCFRGWSSRVRVHRLRQAVENADAIAEWRESLLVAEAAATTIAAAWRGHVGRVGAGELLEGMREDLERAGVLRASQGRTGAHHSPVRRALREVPGDGRHPGLAGRLDNMERCNAASAIQRQWRSCSACGPYTRAASAPPVPDRPAVAPAVRAASAPLHRDSECESAHSPGTRPQSDSACSAGGDDRLRNQPGGLQTGPAQSRLRPLDNACSPASSVLSMEPAAMRLVPVSPPQGGLSPGLSDLPPCAADGSQPGFFLNPSLSDQLLAADDDDEGREPTAAMQPVAAASAAGRPTAPADAAPVIQRMWRCTLARRRAAEAREQLELDEEMDEAICDAMEQRLEEWAAAAAQRCGRGMHGRVAAANLRRARVTAVGQLQRVGRGAAARVGSAARRLERELAAATVQRSVRCWAARRARRARGTEHAVQALAQWRDDAALVLQCGVRQWVARRRVRARKYRVLFFLGCGAAADALQSCSRVRDAEQELSARQEAVREALARDDAALVVQDACRAWAARREVRRRQSAVQDGLRHEREHAARRDRAAAVIQAASRVWHARDSLSGRRRAAVLHLRKDNAALVIQDASRVWAARGVAAGRRRAAASCVERDNAALVIQDASRVRAARRAAVGRRRAVASCIDRDNAALAIQDARRVWAARRLMVRRQRGVKQQVARDNAALVVQDAARVWAARRAVRGRQRAAAARLACDNAALVVQDAARVWAARREVASRQAAVVLRGEQRRREAEAISALQRCGRGSVARQSLGQRRRARGWWQLVATATAAACNVCAAAALATEREELAELREASAADPLTPAAARAQTDELRSMQQSSATASRVAPASVPLREASEADPVTPAVPKALTEELRSMQQSGGGATASQVEPASLASVPREASAPEEPRSSLQQSGRSATARESSAADPVTPAAPKAQAEELQSMQQSGRSAAASQVAPASVPREPSAADPVTPAVPKAQTEELHSSRLQHSGRSTTASHAAASVASMPLRADPPTPAVPRSSLQQSDVASVAPARFSSGAVLTLVMAAAAAGGSSAASLPLLASMITLRRRPVRATRLLQRCGRGMASRRAAACGRPVAQPSSLVMATAGVRPPGGTSGAAALLTSVASPPRRPELRWYEHPVTVMPRAEASPQRVELRRVETPTFSPAPPSRPPSAASHRPIPLSALHSAVQMLEEHVDREERERIAVECRRRLGRLVSDEGVCRRRLAFERTAAHAELLRSMHVRRRAPPLYAPAPPAAPRLHDPAPSPPLHDPAPPAPPLHAPAPPAAPAPQQRRPASIPALCGEVHSALLQLESVSRGTVESAEARERPPPYQPLLPLGRLSEGVDGMRFTALREEIAATHGVAPAPVRKPPAAEPAAAPDEQAPVREDSVDGDAEGRLYLSARETAARRSVRENEASFYRRLQRQMEASYLSAAVRSARSVHGVPEPRVRPAPRPLSARQQGGPAPPPGRPSAPVRPAAAWVEGVVGAGRTAAASLRTRGMPCASEAAAAGSVGGWRAPV